MSRPHRLPVHCLDELATGRGSPETVRLLRSGQVSACLLRIRAILDLVTAGHPAELRRTALDPGYDLLFAVQACAPGVVNHVLGSPEVGAWAMRCLRRLTGSVDGTVPLAVDLGRLGSIAATAAHLAGLDFDVPVPIHQGAVTLPLLGQARFAAGASRAVVRRDGRGTKIHASGKVVRLPADPARDGQGWTGLRHLVAEALGQRLDLRFDDLGPFRGEYGRQPAGRVGSVAFTSWRSTLDQAWSLLVLHHPDRARGLAAGLSALVPLRSTGPSDQMSASSRGSFGAAGMTRPRDAATLAATLVHEFQHSKLGALLDLVTLHAPDRVRHYAPWRDDPRPLAGLLQGAYAFLGVTDFWRVQRTVDGPNLRLAQVEFARWRDAVWQALATLLDSGALTDLGVRFVTGMRDLVAGWLEAAVPDEDLDIARAMAADHRVCWRLRNLEPDPDAVAAIASAWRHGRPGPVGLLPGRLGGTPHPPRWRAGARTELRYLRLRDADRFDRLRADPDRLAGLVAGVTPADLAYVTGDVGSAIAGYREQASRDPGSPDGWAGLVLALRQQGHGVLDAPEVVRAVYLRLDRDGGSTPDPVALASWLAAPARVR